jgi:hypothetical protein
MTDALFNAADLSGWLHQTVTDAAATSAEAVVWGWLSPVLKVDTRPDPVPDYVWAAAVELGGIAYSNPKGLSRNDLGPIRQYFSLERRNEILDEVYRGGLPPSVQAAPRGNFPCAQRYPDPVIDYLRRQRSS